MRELFASVRWKRSRSLSSARSVSGRRLDTITTLYGVGQPGPMTAATCSKLARAGSLAGSSVAEGGPVSIANAGTSSASRSAVLSAPTPTARRTTQLPAPVSRAQAALAKRGAGKEKASSRDPALTSRAGITTTEAPIASSEHSSTPMPSEMTISDGPSWEATTSAALSAVPPIRIARPVVATLRERSVGHRGRIAGGLGRSSSRQRT